MNVTNHGPERWADDGNCRAEARTVIVDGVRQVYQVAGAGPVCLVHSGGPGVHPEYLRIPALEGHLTMVYVDPIGSKEMAVFVQRWPEAAEAGVLGFVHTVGKENRA